MHGLTLVFFMLAAGECLVGSLREDYFWRRPENARLGERFAENVMGDRTMGGGRIPREWGSNYFFTEKALKPVFRNRPTGVRAPTRWWLENERLPYPTIPYPEVLHWIFMHGAEYPRSPGNFRVPANDSSKHTLVYKQTPDQLRVGLRTGFLPSRYRLSLRGGIQKSGFLPQNSQLILSFNDITPDYQHKGNTDLERAAGVQLHVESEFGPVWVSLLRDSHSAALFDYYGPRPVFERDALRASTELGGDELEAALASVLYYRSESVAPVRTSFSQLPEARDLVLPAGCYALRVKTLNTVGKGLLHIRLLHAEMLGCELMTKLQVPAGYSEHVWRFCKSYIPFVFTLEAAFSHAGISIVGWDLKPDPEAMAECIPQQDPVKEVIIPEPLRISFPGMGVLRGMAVCTETESMRYLVRFDLDSAMPSDTFENALIFLHVKDEQGTKVAGWDTALASAAFSDEHAVWRKAAALPSGTYFVDGGLYHKRTTRRFRFEQPSSDTEFNMKRRYARLMTFSID